jgi:CubicO group peptidase (beta-lactamase class C family)
MLSNKKLFFIRALVALAMATGLADRVEAQWEARHGLTPAQYQSTFNELSQQGYRLKCVSGYVSGGSERYEALWVKAAGPAWQARHGMSSADYQKAFDAFAKQGYRLTWVSAHEAGGQLRYEGIWEKTTGPAWQARHGMTASQYQQAFEDFAKQGYRLIHVYGYSDAGSARYAAIWEKSPGPAYEARHGLSAGAFQAAFNDFTRQGYMLKVISGYHVGGEDQYAAIWEKTNGPYWMARDGIPESSYQNVFDNYYYQGYQPAFLTAFTSGGSARMNGIWINTNFKAADLMAIRGAMDEARAAAKIAGLSIAVAKDGRLVYAAGFGDADKENGIEMSVNHRLRIGSISKTVTSVAIFRLIESHAKFGNGQTLSLDSPVFGNGGILGDKIQVPALLASLQGLKIHHLLEHTSGIPSNAGDPTHCASGDLNKRIEYQLQKIQPIAAGSTNPVGPVPRAPGAQFDYSNLNFIILQSVVEAVSGQPYEDYVREHVFAPSHITAARLFRIGPYDPASGEAKHYLTNGAYAEYVPSNTCDMKPPGVGAGGWAMSAKDLLHHLADVDGLGPTEILSQTDRQVMTTGSSANPGYGKGWLLTNWGSCGKPWSIAQGHNGGLSGAFSDLFLLPNGMSFALIANQDAAPNGFCTPVANPGSSNPGKTACGGNNQPGCSDEPLARLVEVLGKVQWPGYNLF